MITVNELRIGNIVCNSYTSAICEVDAIHTPERTVEVLHNKCRSFVDLFCVDPIPLTGDFLEKLGFEYSEGFEDEIPLYCFKGFYIDTDILQPVDLGYPIAKLEIKYVHQLQNLYFALTGEELTLKDK